MESTAVTISTGHSTCIIEVCHERRHQSFTDRFLVLGQLAGCAQPNPHPMDMKAAIQNAKTATDHKALAEHCEEAAEAQVEEHKKTLEQYKQHSYLYGKSAETFEKHCEALINSHEKVAKANQEMAKMHRQMA